MIYLFESTMNALTVGICHNNAMSVWKHRVNVDSRLLYSNISYNCNASAARRFSSSLQMLIHAPETAQQLMVAVLAGKDEKSMFDSA